MVVMKITSRKAIDINYVTTDKLFGCNLAMGMRGWLE